MQIHLLSSVKSLNVVKAGLLPQSVERLYVPPAHLVMSEYLLWFILEWRLLVKSGVAAAAGDGALNL